MAAKHTIHALQMATYGRCGSLLPAGCTHCYQPLTIPLLMQAAARTNDLAGDGTTTATILSAAMIAEGMKIVAAGANPVQVRCRRRCCCRCRRCCCRCTGTEPSAGSARAAAHGMWVGNTKVWRYSKHFACRPCLVRPLPSLLSSAHPPHPSPLTLLPPACGAACPACPAADPRHGQDRGAPCG